MSNFFKIILKIRKSLLQKDQRIYRNSTMLSKKNEIRIKYPLKRLRKPLRYLRKREMLFVNLKWNLQRTKQRSQLMREFISKCLLVLSRVVLFSFPIINWILWKKTIRKNIKSTFEKRLLTLSIIKKTWIIIVSSRVGP